MRATMTARQFAMATARQHVATSGFAYHLARGCDGARCGVLAVELADRVVKAMTDSDERTRPLGDVVAGAVREFRRVSFPGPATPPAVLSTRRSRPIRRRDEQADGGGEHAENEPVDEFGSEGVPGLG